MDQHGINQRKSGLIRKLWPAIWLLTLLLGGCIYSIQPWYEAGAGGADPALLGVWQDAEDEESWVFMATGDTLRLLYREKGRTSEFAAASFHVGGQGFLDLSPAPGAWDEGPAGWYLLPMHGLHLWSVDGDTLRLSSLRPESLENVLALGGHPPLDRREDRWIFTGSRAEMAAFLAGRLLDPGLFGDPTVMVRK
ncbi:MAG: hypothetical protein Q8O14_08555 [bacterium]|jgi:hypothetical protein|nr:hypothetical protein [bacterium]